MGWEWVSIELHRIWQRPNRLSISIQHCAKGHRSSEHSLNKLMRSSDPTLAYYDSEAESFFANTVDVDMSSLYEPFLSELAEGASILDAGCGSGRDARSFHE
jgi:hypothetical protein